MSEATIKKRRPVKRWIILALFAVGIYAAFIGPSILKPISPVVVVPPEETGLSILGFPITNTILATLITDVLLILLALGAYRFSKRGSLVPSGFYNAFETIVEFLWNSVEGTVGKYAKRVFPVVATIFLLVFVANMVKLVPGFESIGRLQEVHKGTGYAPVQLFQLGSLGVFTIDKGHPVAHAAAEGEAHSEGEEVAHGEEGAAELCQSCEVVPFLRGSATDLNFPLALAIIAVFMSQVYGVWALGPSYFEKFFQFKQLVSGGIFGLINFAVGFLELFLELAKILSFSFRLFGNIFAGALLLSILGALTAVALPAGLYLFEIFFGAIQAYVFFLLATVFASMAMVSHHGDEHGSDHH
ncbi:MAG: F0F1 ATP synthase subunit A [Anaerolineales bacterium]|nr:F0F1 ATP synthase subunit A [Anaerolineales bacterium]